MGRWEMRWIDRSIDRGRALGRARGEGGADGSRFDGFGGPETPRAEGEGVFGALASESDDE